MMPGVEPRLAMCKTDICLTCCTTALAQAWDFGQQQKRACSPWTSLHSVLPLGKHCYFSIGWPALRFESDNSLSRSRGSRSFLAV